MSGEHFRAALGPVISIHEWRHCDEKSGILPEAPWTDQNGTAERSDTIKQAPRAP